METNNEERERIAREYFYICYNQPSWKWEQFGKEEHDIWYRIADHIIADRARIVEPLVKFKNGFSSLLWLSRNKDNYCGTDVFCNAIDKTLKLSGVKL